MVIEESSLRQLLASTYGPQCGHAIIECIQTGGEMTVNMLDGSVLVLRSIEEAHSFLRNGFDWTQLPDS